MSDLPDTNGEVAREWIEHARTYYSMAIGAQGVAGSKVAVRSLVSAAEMAIKAVYIGHGTYFPRTHDTKELIDGCPDRSISCCVATRQNPSVSTETPQTGFIVAPALLGGHTQLTTDRKIR